MRLTVTTFVTLDGVYQAPGGPGEDDEGGFRHGGWSFPYADEDFGAAMVGWFTKADASLLGRKTYDIFVSYWPKVTDLADPIASRLNALPKYVVSGSKRPLEWHNSHLVTGNVRAEIAKLKQLPGDELQVHGSGNLVHTLIRDGLADEYRLLVYPVILGTGKRLFPDADIAEALRLTGSKTTGKGVQITSTRSRPVRFLRARGIASAGPGGDRNSLPRLLSFKARAPGKAVQACSPGPGAVAFPRRRFVQNFTSRFRGNAPYSRGSTDRGRVPGPGPARDISAKRTGYEPVAAEGDEHFGLNRFRAWHAGEAAWSLHRRPGPIRFASRTSNGVRAAMAAPTGSTPGRAVTIRTMASSSPALSRANAASAGAAGP